MVKAKAMTDVIHLKEISVTGTVEPLNRVSGFERRLLFGSSCSKVEELSSL